jgi:hypothetical protein
VYEVEVNENLQHVETIEALLFAAIDTASHQHVLEACTLCIRCGTVLKNDEAVLKLCAENLLGKLCSRFSFDLYICVGLALES